MFQKKDSSSYLILVAALVLIVFIGIWVIVSSEFGKRAEKSSLEKKEKEYYYEAGEKPSPSDKDLLKEGDEAPYFKLESIKGRVISLGTLKGKNFLLFFFNSRCGFCKKEVEDLVELAREGKEIVGISVWGEEKSELEEFAQKFKINFPILIDKNDEVARKYFIKGTPTNFVIDKNGVIVEKHRGYAPRVELERILNLAD